MATRQQQAMRQQQQQMQARARPQGRPAPQQQHPQQHRQQARQQQHPQQQQRHQQHPQQQQRHQQQQGQTRAGQPKQLTKRDIASIKEVFTQMDRNGDSRLSFQETTDALTCLGFDCHMIPDYEAKARSGTSLAEFIKLADVANKNTRLDMATLRVAFSAWDGEKKGYITPKQLRQIIVRDGPLPLISEKEISDMLKFFDSNGDGRISLQEFSQLLSC